MINMGAYSGPCLLGLSFLPFDSFVLGISSLSLFGLVELRGDDTNINCVSYKTGKMLQLQRCGLAGTLSRPIQFLHSGEV